MTEVTDVAEYRAAIGHFATGVTVITTLGDAGPSGATSNAVCSVSLDPLLFLASLDRGSRTLEALKRTRRMGVNVLSAGQRDIAVSFASKASHASKFEGVGWREVDGVPVLEGNVAWLTGELHELLPGGDHELALVAVQSVGAEGGDPLVFYGGGYHALSELD